MKTRRHLVIPDVQAKSDIDFSFLTAIGRYAAAKKPDVILIGGDFADLPLYRAMTLVKNVLRVEPISKILTQLRGLWMP